MNSNNPSYQKADAVFFGVSMDLTCSYNKGTAKAPGEILKALGQIEFEPSLSAEQLNDLIEIYSEGIIQAGKVKGRKAVEAEVEKVLKEIELVSEKAVKNNKFFFCFGGEHLVSLGAVRGIAKIIEPKETTIISLDAHCDLKNSLDGLQLSHASWLNKATKLMFNPLLIGVRDNISFEEQDFIKENNLQKGIFPCNLQPKKFYSDEKFGKGKCDWLLKENFIFDSGVDKKVLGKILSEIKTKNVFISIDVDVLGYGVLTGTPSPMGMNARTLQELLFEIVSFCKSRKKRLLGFDIVESIPDKENAWTQSLCAVLSMNLLYWQFGALNPKN